MAAKISSTEATRADNSSPKVCTSSWPPARAKKGEDMGLSLSLNDKKQNGGPGSDDGQDTTVKVSDPTRKEEPTCTAVPSTHKQHEKGEIGALSDGNYAQNDPAATLTLDINSKTDDSNLPAAGEFKGAVEYAQQHFGKVYQRNTFTAYAIIFLVLVAMEGPLLCLSNRAVPVAPYVSYQLQYENLTARYSALETADVGDGGVEVSTKIREFGAAGEIFNAVVTKAYADGAIIWPYEIGYFSITLVFLLFLTAASYKFRHHPNVRSRGHQYLVSVLLSSFLFIVTVWLNISNWLFRWSIFEYPDARNPENYPEISRIRRRFLDSLITTVGLGCFFLNFSLWSMVMRQRMISHIFNHSMRRRQQLEYFQPFPIACVAAVLTTGPFVWWRISTDMDPRKTPQSCFGILLCGVCLSFALGYYTWTSRKAHLKFSDWHGILRTLCGTMFFTAGVTGYVTFYGKYTVIAHAMAYSCLGRFAVNLFLADQLVGVLVQARYADLMPPLTQRSVSVALTRNL